MRGLNHLLLLAMMALFAQPSFAALESSTPFANDFRKAASSTHHFSQGHKVDLYSKTNDSGSGAKISGFFFDTDSDVADIEHRAQLTTIFVNGTYDLPLHLKSDALPLRPYVMGSVGLAVYDNENTAALLQQQGMDIMPVFRAGVGVAYRMDQQWDLSLSYKTGFTGQSSLTTGRSQERVNLEMIDIGFKYRF
jgi:hypothetical protein